MSKFFFGPGVILFLLAPMAPGWAAGPKVAVIGGGGSGLMAAWLLEADCQVTLFEKDPARLGGHADTATLNLEGEPNPVHVESGFGFFGRRLYPKFNRLLAHLGLEVHSYRMNYTFHRTGEPPIVLPPNRNGRMAPGTLLPHNLFTLLQFKTLLNKAGDVVAAGPSRLKVADFLQTGNVTQEFREHFILPFLASMYGVSKDDMRHFLAEPVLTWLVKNAAGGMRGPEFLELKKGLQAYVKGVQAELKSTQVRLGHVVTGLSRADKKYTVQTNRGNFAGFDVVVIATNAQMATQLVESLPDFKDVREALSQVKYFRTHIAIHGDTSYLPPDPGTWGVINIRYDGDYAQTTVHAPWWSQSKPVLKSWVTREVATNKPLPKPLYRLTEYWHPIMDPAYLTMQQTLAQAQGRSGLWFTGVHVKGLDSHESAIESSVVVARALAPGNARLRILDGLPAMNRTLASPLAAPVTDKE